MVYTGMLSHHGQSWMMGVPLGLGPVMCVCGPRASHVRVLLGPGMCVLLGPVMCEALGPVRLLPCACGGDVLSPATAVMMSPATAIQAAMRWCCDESGYCHR